MAWRGCGAAAPGSLSACVLHPFPFPENPRSFPAGSPARHPVISRVPVQFRSTTRMCKHPKRSAANFAPSCCSLGGVRLGTVPLRLVRFAGVLSALGVLFFARGWVARHQDGRTAWGAPLLVCGCKMADFPQS